MSGDGDEEAADADEDADDESGLSDSDGDMPEADGGKASDHEGMLEADSDEEMPDFVEEAGHQDSDGWGSSIEFDISNAGVVLISTDDEYY